MITYKIDVLAALKEAGYNTSRIRKEKLIAEITLQKLRHRKPVSFETIDTLCRLLNYQPGDILQYSPLEETERD